jgi:DNA-directed RNA polymerase sigma subunit (sigma70/sigma32)
MQPTVVIPEELLSRITVRQRAILKLQFGSLPLSEEELNWVVAEQRAEATVVRPRTLEEVAGLIGVSRERVRQINTRSLGKLGLNQSGER